MRNLLALLLLAPCALLAQVPDYVPTDGLVAIGRSMATGWTKVEAVII